MADYSIIADVSSSVLKIFRESLCPELIASPESIALVTPTDKNGDFQLGMFLYDIKELSEYRSNIPHVGHDNMRRFPDFPLTLSYLLFTNSKAQIAAGADMEQRILGKAIQAIRDNSTVNLKGTNPYLGDYEETTGISVVNLNFEDKSKIWSALSTPYQVGVYFAVSPVFITPQRVIETVRVTKTDFSTEIIK